MSLLGKGYFFAHMLLAFLIGIMATSIPSLAQEADSVNADNKNQGIIKTDSAGLDPKRKVLIDNIFVTGNKKTNEKIILRELGIERGKVYVIEDLETLIARDRNNVYNTKLFNTVEIGILELDFDKVDIVVKVTERWYLFPIPLIDIIDRNFNDWWVNQGADLSRIIYGLSVYHFNMRGMNERMTVTAQFGFSRRYEFEYELPYIDKSQRNGLGVFVRYQEYTNLHYNNIANKRIFFDSETLLKTGIFTGVNYVRRNSIFTRHHLNLRYSDNTVADTVLLLNPNYFGISGNRQQYFSLNYKFSHDKRDIQAYPLEGFKTSASIEKIGLGIFDDIDITSLRINFARYIKMKKGFYFSNYSSVYLSTPNDQPYSMVKGLGFNNDVVRGYELYVIHGQHYFVNKTSFKKVLLAGTKQLKNFPMEQFQHFPYAIYLKTYFDIGYSVNTRGYEGNGPLADQLLFGGGMGLDIVTMYDVVIRLEYSVNSLGEAAFFFAIESEF